MRQGDRSDCEAEQKQNNISTDLDLVFQKRRKTEVYSDQKAAAKRVNTDTSDHLKNSSFMPMIASFRKEKSEADLNHESKAFPSDGGSGLPTSSIKSTHKHNRIMSAVVGRFRTAK